MNKLQLVENLNLARTINYRKEKEGENFAQMPDFSSGDHITVAVRVIEGEKERIQNFKGIVIEKRGSGINQTFRVRKISNGVGVERIFPLFSPMIQGITIDKSGKVRRAKLFYLRGMSEKKIRQKIK